MSQPKSLTLRQNFSWTFVGNIIYAASQWGMLVVLAKLGSPEMVGQFTLGLAVTAPIILLSNLQLRQIQATDVDGKYQFGDYFGLRLICTGVALSAIAMITLTAGYRRETSLAILVIGFAKALESITDVFHGLFQLSRTHGSDCHLIDDQRAIITIVTRNWDLANWERLRRHHWASYNLGNCVNFL